MTTITQNKTTEYVVLLPITTYATINFDGPEGLTPEEVADYLFKNDMKPITCIEEEPTGKRAVAEQLLANPDINLQRFNEELDDFEEFNPETNTWENY